MCQRVSHVSHVVGRWVSGRVVDGWVAHADKHTEPLFMHIYTYTHAHIAWVCLCVLVCVCRSVARSRRRRIPPPTLNEFATITQKVQGAERTNCIENNIVLVSK